MAGLQAPQLSIMKGSAEEIFKNESEGGFEAQPTLRLSGCFVAA
jgi:hypothetical protein